MQELFSQPPVRIQEDNTTKAFTQAYQGLNEAQKLAVDTLQGPVMVIAGPGTGKTEMLAVRVGNILLQPDVHPSNILCLTFSNAGVQSMRQRLQQLIGSTADQLAIYTFHSFSNRIIQRAGQGDTFNTRALINDTQRYMLLEQLLSDQVLAGKHACVKPPSGYRLHSLAGILSDMKKEGLNRASLNRLIDYSMTHEIPFDDRYLYKRKEGLKPEGLAELVKLENFKSIGAIYEAYNQQLKVQGLFEYEDMMDAALQIFTSDESLLLDYREQYQYILVDEFQDTNTKQLELIYQLLSDEQPNIFFVGDDDQCIYKFQGASTENIRQVQQLLTGLKIIELEKNYRSTQAILDFSKGLLNQAATPSPYKTKTLTAGRKDRQTLTSEISMQEYASCDQEAYHICEKIQQLLAAGQKAADIAILYRKSALKEVVIKWLQHFSIPYTIKARKKSLFHLPLGKELLSLLRYLNTTEEPASELNNALLHYLLHKAGPAQATALYEAFISQTELNERPSYRAWLEGSSNEGVQAILPTLKKAEALKTIWDHPIEEEHFQVLLEVLGLHNELQNSWKTVLEELVLTEKKYTWATLTHFLSYTESYGLNTLSIEEADTPEDKIVLSTLHGSKGLEYHTVFIIGCSTSVWESAQSPSDGVAVPHSLKKHLNRMGDDLDDLRRLLYVGLTRSKVNLYVSYAKDVSSKRNAPQPSRFLQDLTTASRLSLHPVAEAALPTLQADTYTIDTSHPLRPLLEARLKTFALSATALSSFISCENEFLLTQLCKLPSSGSEALAFGSAIHNTLEIVTAAQYNRTPLMQEVFTVWKTQLETLAASFHPLHLEGYRRHGEEVLNTYITNHWKIVTKRPVCEQSLTATTGGVKLKGKLDRIDIDEKGVHILDYKTGSAKKLKPFINSEDPGDGLWRQGAIYAALIKANYTEALASIHFHFVEHGKASDFPIGNLPETWTTFLQNVWTQIHSYTFKKRCSKEYCHACNLMEQLHQNR